MRAHEFTETLQPELTDGQGFERTAEHNGITLRAVSNGHGALQIKAFVQGKKAGEAYFEKASHGPSLVSQDTTVYEPFRRKGVATAMYQYARSLGNSLVPSTDLTPDGVAMWTAFTNRDALSESRQATADQVLSYVKRQHQGFGLDDAVLEFPHWQLSQVPLNQLEIPDPEPGEVDQDPYDRVQWMDMAHVADIDPQDIKNRPIVIDSQGYIIDGNHRALAARLMGMQSIPAWHPTGEH
jgi:hypothetical protein